MYDAYRQPFFNFVSRLLVERYHPENVLDVGCGGGGFVQAFTDLGVDSCGTDKFIDGCLESAKGRLQAADLNNGLPYRDSAFSMVTCCEVIEHLESPLGLLREINRVLKPKGVLYLSTPTPPFFGEKFYLFAGIWPNPEHINVHSKSYWGSKFSETGFLLKETLTDKMNEFRLSCPSRRVGVVTRGFNLLGLSGQAIKLRSHFSGHLSYRN